MLSEAQSFWEAISGKVRQLIRSETENTYRCERYEVTTAANGTQMGVSLPMGGTEIFLPYSSEVKNATVGTPVMVVWWKTMSNAKVCYYADGYRGDPLAAYPVGAYYWSSDSTSPATLFGGTWEQIQNTFLYAVGPGHPISGTGSSGGEETHTLTTLELPSHTHNIRHYSSSPSASPAATCIEMATKTYLENATYGAYATGGGEAHNNMPPYITAYCWHRTG